MRLIKWVGAQEAKWKWGFLQRMSLVKITQSLFWITDTIACPIIMTHVGHLTMPLALLSALSLEAGCDGHHLATSSIGACLTISQLFHLIWILYSILKKNSTKVEARVVKGDLVGIFSLKRWMKAVLIFKRRTYGLLSSFSEDEAKTNEYRLWENKISF